MQLCFPRGPAAREACTRHPHVHAQTHLYAPHAYTCAHSHAPHPHGQSPTPSTLAYCASRCSHQLLLLFLLGLVCKASVMKPQQIIPYFLKVSLDTPGLTRRELSISVNLSVCGGVSHSEGAPGQTP